MKSKAVTTTHASLCFMLRFARCFGMVPLSGINAEDYTLLNFRWTSGCTLYSLLFLLLSSLNTGFQVHKMTSKRGPDFGYFVTLLFYMVTAVTVATFIGVARKWPPLMKRWTEVDKAMSSCYGFPPTLHKHLKIVAVLVMTAAILEHSLFLAFMFKYSEEAETFWKAVQLYFYHNFDHVFNILPYFLPTAIITQIVNTFSTVSWNFMDLFIMLVSLSLSARFRQVVLRVRDLTKEKEKNESVWQSVREDYTRLVSLCITLDDTISTIMLVSFGNNLFVVLVQLYFSLERPPSHGLIDKIYYLYSFSFLIIRTMAVALFAATINSESKKPLFYLNTISNSVYNTEIERFIYQTKYNTCALTGHRLFRVNKSLILRIAGAIVSYELVLIQFNVG